MSLLPGAKVGPFLVVRALGEGGQATVWAAHDELLGRDVAIKILTPGLATAEAPFERLRREARALAALNHDHVLPILQWGEHNGRPYLVLPLVVGGSIQDVLAASGPLTWAQARPILRDVASALSAAHGIGIIHRDIKPSNVLVERTTGRAILADFGIALTVEDSIPALTEEGVAVGTPHFMSPEQKLAGLRATTASDIYAFGVLAHELVDAETVPDRYAVLLRQCMDADPMARPSADALRQAMTASEKVTLAAFENVADWWNDVPRAGKVVLVIMLAGVLSAAVLVAPTNAKDDIGRVLLKMLRALI